MEVRGASECITDFEGGGLLAFDAVGIDGINDLDAGAFTDLADDTQGVIKIPAQGDDGRAFHQGLGQFAHGDGAFGEKHHAFDARPRGVSCGGGGGVAGARADHGFCAAFDSHRDRHGHATVFEGSGRVQSLVLEPNLQAAADDLLQIVGVNEGSVALAQGHDGCLVRDGQILAILFDDSAPRAHVTIPALSLRGRLEILNADDDGLVFDDAERVDLGHRFPDGAVFRGVQHHDQWNGATGVLGVTRFRLGSFALEYGSDADIGFAENVGNLGDHARPILDCQSQVVARLDVVDGADARIEPMRHESGYALLATKFKI